MPKHGQPCPALRSPIAAASSAPASLMITAVLKNAVSVDLKNVNFESSVQVQLYSGDTLLTTATLQGVSSWQLWFPDLLHRYRDC